MPSRDGPPLRRVAWFVPAWMLLAVVAGVALVRGAPPGVLGGLLGALVLVPVGWVLVSTLWPPVADRSCPACGADALERLDRKTTVGVRCTDCGHVDENASAWLLAEEEGPLEDVVLSERGRGRAGGGTAVDSPRPTD